MTTDQPYSPPLPPPYRGGDGGGGRSDVLLRARPSRLHTWFHIVELVLLTICAAILILFTVKYFQVVNAIEDFSNQVGSSFETPSPDPGVLPTCEPGQEFGCVDPGD